MSTEIIIYKHETEETDVSCSMNVYTHQGDVLFSIYGAYESPYSILKKDDAIKLANTILELYEPKF